MEYPISIQEAIDELEAMREELIGYMSVVGTDAYDMAIEALEFMGKYDAVWEGIKCAGEHGKEVELHRYGRVYRIREVST